MHACRNDKTILIGEDEPDVRRSLEMTVRSLGYSVEVVREGDEVLSFLQGAGGGEVSAVVLDLVRHGLGGLDVLREVRSAYSRLPVIIVSGSSSAPEAVAAMKSGASDFLGKPFTHDDLARALAGITEGARSHAIPAPGRTGNPRMLEGTSPGVREMQARVRQIGWSGVPVVIQGETGSGKEVLARELHAESARAGRPFLKLNCAALPSELVESELFGYERGAFTGAFQKKSGMFELADSGTILLDEIGDMDVRLQAKLLQVLQDQEFRRVGGRELVKVDVRVIAATHRDLEAAIRAGSFREDLYYRLNVITLHVPPLRERGEDILRIGEFLLKKYAGPNAPQPAITLVLRQAMLAYDWPGNVRELENYMRKLVIFNDPDVVARELQARSNRKAAASARNVSGMEVAAGRSHGVPLLAQVTKVNRQAESEAILAALNSTHWNRKQAAMILKVDYKSLLYKMKKLGIDDHPAFLADTRSAAAETPLAASGD